jgi:penicillin-binding protein 1A
MQEALKDQPATPFRIPPGIELVRINPTTGQLARPDDKNAILEAYKPGTEPNAAGAGVVVSGNVPSAGLGLDGGGGGDTDGADSPQPVPASGTGGLY